MPANLQQQLLDLAMLGAPELAEPVREMARLSLFDWLICGRAGFDEPVAKIIRNMARQEAGSPQATVFGGRNFLKGKCPARMAALCNGTISHAVDFDDTHFGHVGHLSVAVYPAALAAAEVTKASVAQLIDSFSIGAEAAIRIGMILGSGHYNRGFHQTATAGAFGAMIAAGRLYGLERSQMRHGLSLCATAASGLKSQFGTMGKPYNAGLAASKGVEAAQLAKAGMISAADGLFGPQGFIDTHSDHPSPDAGFTPPPAERFLFLDNKYKFHACCHGLHAMIEALMQAVNSHSLTPKTIAAIDICTNPRWLSVCDKKAPTSGLEVKFSYSWLAGMVVHDMKTGNDRLYSDDLAADPHLQQFTNKVTVRGDDEIGDMEVSGTIKTMDGREIMISHDLNAPIKVADLREKLQQKAVAMLGNEGREIGQKFAQFHDLTLDDISSFVAG